MTRMELIPAGDDWLLPVAGQQVTQCTVDYAGVAVLCGNGISFYIEQPFTLVAPDGQSYLLDPDPRGDAADLAPVLRIMRKVVRDGTAFHDGRLALAFEDGSRIEVPSSQKYEAWNISGPGSIGHLRVVSIPGGDLAIWRDTREDAE